MLYNRTAPARASFGFGQVPVTHPAVVFARQNSRPLKDAGDISTNATRNLVVSTTKSEIIRVGVAAGNQVFVFQFIGSTPGRVYSMPVDVFLKDYRLIEGEDARKKIYSVLPMPSKVETEYTLERFVTDVDDALTLANQALSEARSGNLASAQGSVAKAVGKRGEFGLTLRLLWSFYQISDESYEHLAKNVFGLIDADVDETAKLIQAVSTSGYTTVIGAINDLQAKIAKDLQSIAEALAEFSQTLLDDFSTYYGLVLLTNDITENYLNTLKVNNVPIERVAAVEKTLSLGKAIQLDMATRAQGIGLSATDIKIADSLEDLGQGLFGFLKAFKFAAWMFRGKVTTKVAKVASRVKYGQRVPFARLAKETPKGLALALTLGKILGGAALGTTSGVIVFVYGGFWNHLKVQADMEAKAAAAAQKQDPAPTPDKTKQRENVLEASKGVVEGLKETLPSVPSNDPILKEGGAYSAQITLQDIENAQEAAFGKKTNILPFVVGGAALLGLGLYFYSKRKE